MRLMALDMRLLTLVPNHLSTVNKYQYTPSITNPKSTKPPKNHSQNQKNNPTKGLGRRREWKREGKRSGNEDAEEKRGVEKIREVHIDTNA